jgi:hypothetical protein
VKGQVAAVIPPLQRVPWAGRAYAISRDQAFQLFIVLNQLLLGVETTLAHMANGTLRPYELIPIGFGPLAGVVLIAAYLGLRRARRWARTVALWTYAGSIAVGVLGTYFHLARSLRPLAPAGQRVTLSLLVWGAAPLAPAAFVLVGALGFLTLAGLPEREKDRFYMLAACAGVLIAVVSSVFDHLRGGFANPWLWVPTATGTFAAVVALATALLSRRSRGDLTIYAGAMALLLLVGPLGLWLHLRFDLAPGTTIVIERLLRKAPILAPMVFANMGLLGLLALLDPLPGPGSD